MSQAYIVDAIRTPIGRRKGGLARIRPDDLAAIPLTALTERNSIKGADVEDVIMGCVTQVGEQGLNIGRNAALIAGFPKEVTGTSVNRLCGSSQQAVNFGAMAVQSGAHDLVIGAGIESMTRVEMGSDMFYRGELKMPSEKLTWQYTFVQQGVSAELIAQKYGITRPMLDSFALESHRRAAAAQDGGKLNAEIIPVDTIDEDGSPTTISADEGVRRDTTLEKLASLKTPFMEGGVISAAASSQISDGASALLLANDDAVQRYGLKPRARIVSMATAGVDPTIMLTGPMPATAKALDKAGMSISDIDIFEVNEAFASVVLAWSQDMGVNMDKVNIYGGACALGHPLGASGARLLTTLLNALEQEDKRFGLSTMCIGFGQGIATVIERLDN
ncbi:MAG: acetyl-CoA C-acyltransferase [Rickettsiales bacterium]|nr:acetyl-CoA C-acyltransferase [Rickettsiales bacterium]|tara:strand:+ start:1516 stop:2682 length:1167 start_codon:yes stop_codon:yes gene_type:complete